MEGESAQDRHGEGRSAKVRMWERRYNDGHGLGGDL